MNVGVGASAAMVAFAANSLLCRMALAPGAIDAASFTTVRFVSGAAALLLFATATGRPVLRGGSWRAALVLFVYAFPFAFAYSKLGAGTGALVLFGSVQVTMIAVGLASGERPSAVEWAGFAAAIGGLLWLVAPGLATSPSPAGVALMAVAGAAWGVYSLLGRQSTDPIAATAGTFVRLAPATLAVSALTWPTAHASPQGLGLALLSGVVTSGGGYIVWYHALRSLTATRAAVLQLSVPALAAVAGTLLLDEPLTVRLVTAAALILGGIAASITRRSGHT